MPHRGHLFIPVALALFAAGCDRPPTEPRADARRPRLATAAADAILAQDLGVLAGDVRSEASYVTEDGVVYGRSFATNNPTPVRFFRWTAGVMVQVSAIPQPPAPPKPVLSVPPPPPAFEKVLVAAANAKGEATGVLCVFDCDSPSYNPNNTGGHAFRSSPAAGARNIDLRFGDPPEFEPIPASRGWSINRWGHVAGAYWAFGSDPVAFFWTPLPGPHADLGQFVPVGTNSMSRDFGDMQVNDIDQVIGRAGGIVFDPCAFVWRPDLGNRELLSAGVPCENESGSPGRALAQQTQGTLVVGWARFPGPAVHAALWRVPAVNRAGFPEVNASPITFTSTISLSRTGGRYFQFYRATQSPAAGPYLELVDWGDGTTSRRTRSSVGVTTSQSHVYTKTGTFWVRVYVQDANGRWDVAERKLTVTS